MEKKTNRTRAERACRTRRRLYLLSLILFVTVLASAFFVGRAVEPIEPETAPPPVVVQPEPEPLPEPEYNPAYEKEAVLNVYDPVRTDIPMDAELQRLLYEACGETGIRYELALAVIWQETNFRNIVGDGGDSIGYMQVQPRWHSGRMERLGVTDLSDPYSNFLVGCDYLAELVEQYKNTEQALVAYNQGSFKGTVTEYAKSVIKYMKILTMEEI